MHPYSIDSGERESVSFFIAAISILAAWAFYSLLAKYGISLSWWIDAPSAFGFYGIIIWFFDHYGWRWNIFKTIGLIKTPIIDGRWKGKIISSYNNTEKEADLYISQTWTKMELIFKTDSSQSHSSAAFISICAPGGPSLAYQYQNDPSPNTPGTMQIHYGSARVSILENKIEGDYYSGRGRQNTGSIVLEKQRSHT